MNTKITLEVGEKDFMIEVRELTTDEKRSLSDKIAVEQHKVDAFVSARSRLTDLTEEYETNKKLLFNAEMSLGDKVKMLWEQKELLLEIKKLRPDVEAKGKMPIAFESIAKEQFELTVSGSDKMSLMSELEKYGKTYREVLNIILPKVAEAKEKKSSSS